MSFPTCITSFCQIDGFHLSGKRVSASPLLMVYRGACTLNTTTALAITRRSWFVLTGTCTILPSCVLCGPSLLHDTSLTIWHVRFGMTASGSFILPVQESQHAVGQAPVDFFDKAVAEIDLCLGWHNRCNYFKWHRTVTEQIFRGTAYGLRSVLGRKRRHCDRH